ncbi:uncharacterized protein CMU_039050 [Cryptosporidium muris RN66]|uniref:Uncharacterized protein n=1 Tax=Cryptosporidium muris (strain RN66) TaxID=441375 RepID=B6A9E7_CRYMR|nr:uncharacterized protein CMU_039050 [Cryptosporidium muris RN66]EEA04838.1 hypothetical protein, conserved [Cryptosporidium muris RN66]|eukprot:XP_002139187.1 hypothetical protein [Cryptosporidium muris RN66]
MSGKNSLQYNAEKQALMEVEILAAQESKRLTEEMSIRFTSDNTELSSNLEKRIEGEDASLASVESFSKEIIEKNMNEDSNRIKGEEVESNIPRTEHGMEENQGENYIGVESKNKIQENKDFTREEDSIKNLESETEVQKEVHPNNEIEENPNVINSWDEELKFKQVESREFSHANTNVESIFKIPTKVILDDIGEEENLNMNEYHQSSIPFKHEEDEVATANIVIEKKNSEIQIEEELYHSSCQDNLYEFTKSFRENFNQMLLHQKETIDEYKTYCVTYNENITKAVTKYADKLHEKLMNITGFHDPDECQICKEFQHQDVPLLN